MGDEDSLDFSVRCENGAVRRCRRRATKFLIHHVVDHHPPDEPTASIVLCPECFAKYTGEAIVVFESAMSGDRQLMCQAKDCRVFFMKLSNIILEVENL